MRTRQKRVATDTWRSLGCRTTPLEHWSRRKPTVEPRWAKQQTKKLRQGWYDNKCTNKYKHLKCLSRQLVKNSWDNHVRSKICYEHKVYKTLVRKKHRLFKNKLLGNLIENEKKNPKDFWKTVNTLLKSNKGDTSKDMSPDTWIQHFKSLLNMNYADNFPRNDTF